MSTFAPSLGGPVVIDPPTKEPVERAELVLASQIDDDAAATAATDIELTIAAARIWAETYTKKTFVSTTYEITLDRFPPSSGGSVSRFGIGWGGGEIVLPRPPLQSVVSVKYIDGDGNEQTMDAANYDVVTNTLPGRIRLGYNQSWPSIRTQRDAVTIQYIAGYGAARDVPQSVRKAILALAGHLWDHPESTIVLARGETIPENELIKSLLNTERWTFVV